MLLLASVAAALFITTMSRPASSSCPCRNDSLTIRLSLFLPLAVLHCFFEMASPSRAIANSLRRQSTVNHLSRLRVAFWNTRSKDAVSGKRWFSLNRYRVIRSNSGVLFAVVTTQ